MRKIIIEAIPGVFMMGVSFGGMIYAGAPAYVAFGVALMYDALTGIEWEIRRGHK